MSLLCFLNFYKFPFNFLYGCKSFMCIHSTDHIIYSLLSSTHTCSSQIHPTYSSSNPNPVFHNHSKYDSKNKILSIVYGYIVTILFISIIIKANKSEA